MKMQITLTPEEQFKGADSIDIIKNDCTGKEYVMLKATDDSIPFCTVISVELIELALNKIKV